MIWIVLPEILPRSFVGDHLRIHSPTDERADLGEFNVQEAFVVTKIKIGLGAVDRHEDLAVFRRVERSGVGI